MATSPKASIDTLRRELRERIDLLSEMRLQTASDFIRWLEQIEDDAEIEMLSRSRQFRQEMEAATRAADAAPKVDWRTVRDDV